jgi:hypothetical protein
MTKEMVAQYKFPDALKLQTFLNLFFGQKEHNEWRGEKFLMDAYVDWTTNSVRIWVTDPNDTFAKVVFEHWCKVAIQCGGTL